MTRYYSWTRHGIRKHAHVHTWGTVRGFLSGLRIWLAGRWDDRWGSPFDVYLVRNRDVNGWCYCPTGHGLKWRVAVFNCGAWGTYNYDPTKRPCICDQVLAEMETMREEPPCVR